LLPPLSNDVRVYVVRRTCDDFRPKTGRSPNDPGGTRLAVAPIAMNAAGTFGYHSQGNPAMVGTLIVVQ
jgi:hypothetical protein